ncbi:MAG: hypothetical protein KBD78_12610 [Oligoflexales bacterium]|nr:hypothetical protein [Oligoflexales bacterium]
MIVFKKYRILAASLAFSAVAVLSACGSKSDKASTAPAADLGSGQGLGVDQKGPGQTDEKVTPPNPNQGGNQQGPGQSKVDDYDIEDCSKGADQSVDQNKGGKGKDCGKGKDSPKQNPGQNDGKGPGQNPGQNPRSITVNCASSNWQTIDTASVCDISEDLRKVVSGKCLDDVGGFDFDVINGKIYVWGGCKLHLTIAAN